MIELTITFEDDIAVFVVVGTADLAAIRSNE